MIEPVISYSYYQSNRDEATHDFTTITRRQKDEVSEHQFSLGARLGIYYFISKKFALETTLTSTYLTKSIGNEVEYDLMNNTEEEEEYSVNMFYLKFINSFNFSQLIKINYYF